MAAYASTDILAARHMAFCVTTLRHSYAVNRLESGVNLRQVQQELGHASIRTSERYQRCIAPKLAHHPFTEVRRRMARDAAPTPLAKLASIDIRNLRLPFARPRSTAMEFLRMLCDRVIGGIIKRRPRSPEGVALRWLLESSPAAPLQGDRCPLRGLNVSVPSDDGRTRETLRWTCRPCLRPPCWPLPVSPDRASASGFSRDRICSIRLTCASLCFPSDSASATARPFGVTTAGCGSVVEWHLSGSGLPPRTCRILCLRLTSRSACASGTSPDKNANCNCTTSAFTSVAEPWTSLRCASSSTTSALYVVSVRRLTVLLSGFLPTVGYPSAVLPFRSCLRLVFPLRSHEHREVHIQGT